MRGADTNMRTEEGHDVGVAQEAERLHLPQEAVGLVWLADAHDLDCAVGAAPAPTVRRAEAALPQHSAQLHLTVKRLRSGCFLLLTNSS
jgi:hypothetical protein